MKKLVIFDVDGTLVHMPHNGWEGETFNWDSFLSWMDSQDVIQSTLARLMAHHSDGCKIVAVTARPEEFRERTEALLRRITIDLDAEFDELHMRTDDEAEIEAEALIGVTDESEIKRIIFNHHSNFRIRVKADIISSYHNITHAYDDQEPNLKVWEGLGAECWLVDADGELKRVDGFYQQ